MIKSDKCTDGNKPSAAAKKVTCCCCPGSKPGIINIDPLAHLPNCRIRKKLVTGRFTMNTSVVPTKFNDGCELAVALAEEGYY
jgi:hypothetical protein